MRQFPFWLSASPRLLCCTLCKRKRNETVARVGHKSFMQRVHTHAGKTTLREIFGVDSEVKVMSMGWKRNYFKFKIFSKVV